MSLHTFDAYIGGKHLDDIPVIVSVTSYYPGTPDTWHAEGEDPEIEWHFVTADGQPDHNALMVATDNDLENIQRQAFEQMESAAAYNRDLYLSDLAEERCADLYA